MANYYYLIAGLADVQLDADKLPYSIGAFREEVVPQLTAEDRKLIGLALADYDNRNLLALLKKEKAGEELMPDESMQTGICSIDQLAGVIESVRNGESDGNDAPKYMYSFVREYLNDSWHDSAAFVGDRLSQLFYGYALESGNEFVRNWFRFNLDLNNIQVAITARKHGLQVQNLIIGDGEVADALRSSGAKDWGLSQSIDYLDRLMRIQEIDDLSAREREVDMIKWNWLEDNTFFHFFTVEKLFAFVVRLDIVDRWLRLDKDKGQELFRSLIGSLKGEVEIPGEFM
ncbi:MAG: DUF2764 family protein [Bacteroidaceae bacterium]|nr:DUF2764 family protein [Bacteroidaceae bacterium]